MTTSSRSQSFVAFAAGLIALATACGGGTPPGVDEQPGQAGTSWLLTVSRQPGGTVTTKDGKIACGSAPTATRCGPVSYGWTESATLVATADAGFMFGTWAGDCSGRSLVSGEYVCVLDTRKTGADKYVVPVFGEAGRTIHGNFNDPVVHGPAFVDWKAGKVDAFECTYCHGATYAGLGIAPSCNDCHARNGSPGWQTDCTFCHEAPPPVPHPQAFRLLTDCALCHATTVDASGAILADGTHINGKVEGGHEAGYADPKVHGRDFFQFVGGDAALACNACHGAAYDRPVVDGTGSCTSCHETNGWTGWRTNCSFCHGVNDDTTKAGYVLADHPTWSTPPDTIAQRLGESTDPSAVGAHAVHLTGSAYARAFACDVCHPVPTSFDHVSGRSVRAEVTLKAPGQAAEPDVAGYDPLTGTCTTTCHGRTRKLSPPWTATAPLACDGCHDVPPATPAHVGLTGNDLTQCAGCHPDSIDATGTTMLSEHVNGMVDRVEGHTAGFAAPAQHGSQFLDYAAQASGATDCLKCHGTAYAGCNACHAKPENGAWQAWQTNCTFCHGARVPAYTSADLTVAAPPDTVGQRLTGATTGTSTRIGKHRVHLTGKAGYIGTRCEACHPVTSAFQHVSPDRRAEMVFTREAAFPNLTAEQYAALPDPLMQYSPSTNRCSGYCHGSTMIGGNRPSVLWSQAIAGDARAVDCLSCHGNPPESGRTTPVNVDDPYCPDGCDVHSWHNAALPDLGYDTCDNCHFGSAPTNTGAVHVNGVKDIVWSTTGKAYTASWNGTAKTCTASCHQAPATPYGWYAPAPGGR